MHPDDDSSSDDATPLAHIYTHVVLLASELSDLAATRHANSAEVVLAQRQLQVAAFWIAEADRPHPAPWSIRPHRATAGRARGRASR